MFDKTKAEMIRPWFRQAAVPWKTTATQTRASGENRVSTKLGVLHRCGDGVPGLGDLLLGGRDGLVLGGGGKVRGGEQGGQLAVGGGQDRLGLAQPGAGGLALGVGDQVVIVLRPGAVVAQPAQPAQ